MILGVNGGSEINPFIVSLMCFFYLSIYGKKETGEVGIGEIITRTEI